MKAAVIDKPGIYDISAAEYHADPAPAPSLSSSIARELLSRSPRHARFAHPRLNPAATPEEADRFEIGTAAHALLLEGDASCVIVDAKDWRTNDAKAARQAAREVGKIALLAHQWANVQAMVAAAQDQLAAHQDPPRPLTFGKPEQTLVWQEGETWCRARLDWLHDHGGHVEDFKTTDGTANPDAWTRGPLYNMGYDVQAAFYLRGLRAIGIEGTFRFVVQEVYPPYALSVIGLAPASLDLAERKVEWAIKAWTQCLKGDRWPGYPTRTCWADLPPWAEAQWMERQGMPDTPTTFDDGRPIADQLFGVA